jgi:threonine synthase
MTEVSESQRKLMTTLKDNIRTVAIDGKFDDCQAMVKRAFSDPDLKHLPLSSANSINIGRLLPQSVYYFYAASRVAQAGEPIVFSMPSGNFGDMMGAIVAKEMGLPVRKIVAAVNDNDAFPKFLATGSYEKISPSRNSLSNAMNVGHPSNLARLISVYGGQMDETGQINQIPDLNALRRDVFRIHLGRTHGGGHPGFLESVSTSARTAWRGCVAGFAGLDRPGAAWQYARRHR